MISYLLRLTSKNQAKAIVILIQLIAQFSVFGQELTFEKEVYDFGIVARNSKQEHFLKFRNTGGDTLVIIGFHGTNNDLDGAIIQGDRGEKMTYPPGKGGTVIYTFDTDLGVKNQGGITIQTNDESERFSVIPVRWEVPLKPIDEAFSSRISGTYLSKHLEMLETNRCFMKNCYENSFQYVMPGSPVLPVKVSNFCDSIRAFMIAEFDSIFEERKRLEIMWNSEVFHRCLIAFESFSRSTYNKDSLILFFEAERRKLPDDIYKCWYKERRHLYKTMLDMISPMTNSFPESQKVDLETYCYLRSLFRYYEMPPYVLSTSVFKFVKSGSTSRPKPPSFKFVRDMPVFEEIDLAYHPKEKKIFQLRGKIVVENLTNKPLILAPYYDVKSTKFDKKSYCIPPKGRMEIDFRSDVNLNETEKSIKRLVKMVNYETKETQQFAIEASFVH